MPPTNAPILSRHGDGLGVRLMRCQNAKGLSSRKLAELSGLSSSVICQMRRGQEKSTRSIIAIAKALNVSTDWLLGLTDEFRELKGEGE